ncbi:hypothetical protein PV325_009932 [Microctonus aethiopoides]|nr:hypothetical protein PV325_009932 [Microctonus aethiopoides]
MTAKQCLRHDWLHDAPTQASPHLRRYLSKSREVLLERVVSRENLRRATLINQTTSQANLTESKTQISGLVGGLSQSEMCLNYSLTGSRNSLTNSDCYMSPANSQSSLNSSQTSIATSQASLITSQSYLLNKEQTQGLLNRAQSRSQANLNHITRRGLLSRMRSLSQIQSQACLISEKLTRQREQLNSMFGSKSQGKLYGLKCLSKSQGVLDIYRSLESIRNIKKIKRKDRAITDELLPIFKQFDNEIIVNSGGIERSESAGQVMIGGSSESGLYSKMENLNDNNLEENLDCLNKNEEIVSKNEINDELIVDKDKNDIIDTEDNFDSLQSMESDTLTEDSDEISINRKEHLKKPSQRQNSDISSHSNNSVNSEDKDEHSETENDEPKYTVAQLVSAFNKHQEVASKTSLEAIMTEKRVNEVTFPTGPKALRLFIPDININERGIVRRKTSYKPRKNWEELRKQNEKNEGILKDFNNDSGNEDEEIIIQETIDNINLKKFSFDDKNDSWTCQTFSDGIEETFDNRDTTIDEKYKQCVDGAKSIKEIEIKNHKLTNEIVTTSILIDDKLSELKYTNSRTSYQRERLPNYIYPEIMSTDIDELNDNNRENEMKNKYVKLNKTRDDNLPQLEIKADNSVNLKDILQKVDCKHIAQKKNMEKLRKQTSITKNILNDNLTIEDANNNENSDKAKIETPCESSSSSLSSAVSVGGQLIQDESTKLNLSSSFIKSSSLSIEASSTTPPVLPTEIELTSLNDVGSNVSTANLRNEKELKQKRESQRKEIVSKNNYIERNDGKKITITPEEKKKWGKVCTGSYTRAMEKFTGKSIEKKKSLNPIPTTTKQSEKIRRKSSPAMSLGGGS